MIEQNLQRVSKRIEQACLTYHRPAGSVSLLAVSKTFGPETVRAALDCGLRAFGENYVQEALDKIQALSDVRAQLQWHLIGPLQSNKTRVVAEHFDWVQSVDRLKIAQRLSEQRPEALPPLNVLIQVNTSGEDSKSGAAPAEVPALARAVAALPRLRLRGLMALPAPTPDEAAQQRAHHALKVLFEQLVADGLALDTLSMGMSADLEAAIAEGATMVRVGTALFGSR
ncbi:MAG TPA: YggS family pyridoxal phosphate-dependent enzyme [Aquabacterium sp.]|uniref:YggS family pyridoxal phosphate-dependent enzyme n=1 Tax=Aquabacterium sp. TaxID=1872578 RepID=UPI002E2EF2A4|nr:YggS family pyridoxal phosphate-dependent enzyme [Aquabacterium sp.]HEX5371518.1 YggS family pyridoxal phosphate-dependent enzyme [Aquabacterium sp.]